MFLIRMTSSTPVYYKQGGGVLHRKMSMIHQLTVESKYFEAIRRKIKTVEGRVKKNRFSQIQPGNFICFIRADKPDLSPLYCKVIGVRVYPSFRQMLTQEGIEKCLPGVKTIDEGIQIYHKFPNYLEDSIKYGVVAFEIQPEDPPKAEG